MFKVKSAEELKGMDAEALHSYYVEKLNHENAELEVRLKSLEDEKNSEKHAELEQSVKELKEQSVATLKAALVEQGVVIEGLKNGSISGAGIAQAEGTIEAALLTHKDAFKSSSEGSKEEFAFDLNLKAVGDMTFSNNLSGGNMPQAQRLDGINNIAEVPNAIYPIIPKISTTANVIDWVYETAQEGAASGTAEGAIKNQIDNNFVVTSVALLKQTAYFKVSTEMLSDVSFMASWLRNKLIVRLMLRVDSQILLGDGTGTNLNGVYTQSTIFAAGTFANTVDSANDADSLVVAMNQIRLANHGGNLTIFMHPSDVTALKLVKLTATDKRYVDRLLQVGSTLMIDGVRIIETVEMTAGTFLVGDMTKALLAERQNVTVEVGLDSGDFLKNMRSILAEWRGEVIIQNNDTTAFVYGVFATTNAALETP